MSAVSSQNRRFRWSSAIRAASCKTGKGISEVVRRRLTNALPAVVSMWRQPGVCQGAGTEPGSRGTNLRVVGTNAVLLPLQRDALRALLQDGTGDLCLAVELELEERPSWVLEAGLRARVEGDLRVV